MKPLIIAPPASYSPDYKSAPLPPRAPSELPPPEPQGQRERSGLATGSLPVLERRMLELDAEWNETAAEHARVQGLDAIAKHYAIKAQRLRRDLGRAIERQPEENNVLASTELSNTRKP